MRARALISLLCLYGAAVYLMVTFARDGGSIAMVRPADALALGALLLFGRARNFSAIAAIGATNAFVHVLVGDGLLASLAFGAANGLDIGLTASLLKTFGVERDQPSRLRVIIGLFFVSIVGPVAGAAFGGLASTYFRGVDACSTIFTWWLLSSVSYLILVPPFLFWRSREERRLSAEYRLRTAGELSRRIRMAELAAAGIALTIAGVLVPLTGQLVLIELSATVLLWHALRFGMFPTAFTAAVYCVCVIVSALLGYWPGSEREAEAGILIPLQATLALTTLPALLVAAIMSQRERARRALRADALRLTYALEGANDGLWDWDFPTGESFFSQRACRMFGYEPDEFGTKSRWSDLVHPEDLLQAIEAFDAHARGETPFYDTQFRARHRDGRWIWIHDRGKVVERDASGGALRAVGTYTDVSERKSLETALEHLATHDALTGLANRGAFERALQRAISRQQRHGGKLAVMLVDVDHFKAVNDTHGHAAGDALLVTIATRLRGTVREDDLVARLGGDEFAVIASAAGAFEFDALAGRINEALSQPLDGPDYTIAPSVSIGIAVTSGGPANDLVLRADRALYAAKNAGRGTWRFFGGAELVA